jgi:nucleoside-diphosphate-sugar epimerase
LIREKLNWEPTLSLSDGLARTYAWIDAQVQSSVSERMLAAR